MRESKRETPKTRITRAEERGESNVPVEKKKSRRRKRRRKRRRRKGGGGRGAKG